MNQSQAQAGIEQASGGTVTPPFRTPLTPAAQAHLPLGDHLADRVKVARGSLALVQYKG